MKFSLPDILIAERAGRAMALRINAPVEIGVSPCLAGAASLAAAKLLLKRKIPVNITLTENANVGDTPFAINLRVLEKLRINVNIDECDAEDYPCVISGTDMTATLGSANFLVAVNFLKYEHEYKWDNWRYDKNPMLFSPELAKVLPVEKMRELERRTIEEFGMPEICLMEHAGIGAAVVADDMARSSGDNGEIVIFAGPGNNGGDAFVVARGLLDRGWPVRLIALGDNYTGVAAQQYEIIQQQPQFISEYIEDEIDHILNSARLIVDGIFGIGLSRDIDGVYAEVIKRINKSKAPVLSLDIPSGLGADDAVVHGCAVRANKTVTFAALKPGMVEDTGAELCGEIVVADIGDTVLSRKLV